MCDCGMYYADRKAKHEVEECLTVQITAMINVMWWICLDLIYSSSVINAQCTGNELHSCAFNFIGTCKWDTKTTIYTAFTGRNLKPFIPKVESFRKPTRWLKSVVSQAKLVLCMTVQIAYF